jgi:hypothetical protein
MRCKLLLSVCAVEEIPCWFEDLQEDLPVMSVGNYILTLLVFNGALWLLQFHGMDFLTSEGKIG